MGENYCNHVYNKRIFWKRKVPRTCRMHDFLRQIKIRVWHFFHSEGKIYFRPLFPLWMNLFFRTWNLICLKNYAYYIFQNIYFLEKISLNKCFMCSKKTLALFRWKHVTSVLGLWWTKILKTLKFKSFSAHSITLYIFFCQGGVDDHGFSRLRLVTPLASAKGWRQPQIRRFAQAQPKSFWKKILRHMFSFWLYKNTEKNSDKMAQNWGCG